MTPAAGGAGRRLDAALRLLDRQIMDCDGQHAGKVDDLELTLPDDPDGGPPIVTALLTGPGALAHRLGGRLGLWLGSADARLRMSPDPGAAPVRIPFGVVKRIGNDVELSVSKRDVEVTRFQDWVREHVVGRIPGAEHAPD